jgi:hypothetical protein
VAIDPCLRPYPPVAAASEEVCLEPVLCDMVCGEEPYPVPRLAAPNLDGECEVVDECETDADCVVKTSYLSCCGCPEAFPAVMPTDEPCLATNHPSSDADCADCSGVLCEPCFANPLIARCEPNTADMGVCATALLLTSLDSLPGGTFEISASRSEPIDSTCSPPDPAAVYSLTFSADGTTVSAVRRDQPDEVVLNGTRVESTDTRVRYGIDDGWTGGDLVVELVSGIVVAELVMYGSGVPIIWCIRAPLEPPR